MKLFLVALLVTVAAGFPQAQLKDKEPIAIVSFRNVQDPSNSGAYDFAFQTGDGVSRAEQGSQRQLSPEAAGQVMQGRVEYTAPDGSKVTLEYVADENGFQPRGSHLPVAPPMPDHVVKLLEDLRRLGAL